jgi:hypothetical protein
MQSAASNIIKECCWALSNIAAGSTDLVNTLIDSHAFDRCFYLAKSYNLDTKKEATWVLCNAITGADVIG